MLDITVSRCFERGSSETLGRRSWRDGVDAGERVHDVGVEHAGVEVDEAVPLLQAVAPPEVDVLLVVGVVLGDGVVPVAAVEEGVELIFIIVL